MSRRRKASRRQVLHRAKMGQAKDAKLPSPPPPDKPRLGRRLKDAMKRYLPTPAPAPAPAPAPKSDKVPVAAPPRPVTTTKVPAAGTPLDLFAGSAPAPIPSPAPAAALTIPKVQVNPLVIPRADRSYRPRAFALPEVIPGDLGAHWHLRADPHQRVGIDLPRKRMVAPVALDPVSHGLRLQQVARIKWHDPEVDLGTFGDSLICRAVEDHRLSYLLHTTGADISGGFFDDRTKSELVAAPGDTALLAYLLMADYTGDDPVERINSRPDGPKIAGPAYPLFLEAKRRIQEDPSQRNAAEVVRWLRTKIADSTVPGCCKQRYMFMGYGFGKGGDLEFPQDAQDWWDLAWEDLEEDQHLDSVPPAVRERLPTSLDPTLQGIVSNRTGPIGLSPWGEMKVEEPARTKQVRGAQIRRWRSTEEGVFPRYHHRLFIDGRVFARRHKVPGGTVVIDASGSMGLTGEAIQRMVLRAPGCLVACYSGNNLGGVLRILAKGGHRVPDHMCVSSAGGGNIVDYPALKWAYRNSHPRIWVSDFGVTGINDSPGAANLVMCAAVLQKGRFLTARNVQEADRILGSLGQYYRKSS